MLTDTRGLEDHPRDMDFKVTGTPGITAISSISRSRGCGTRSLRRRCISVTRRLQILDDEATIAEPRRASAFAPRIHTMQIPLPRSRPHRAEWQDHPSIVEETGVKIDVEDDGTVYIASVNGSGAGRAIRRITADRHPEIGRASYGRWCEPPTLGPLSNSARPGWPGPHLTTRRLSCPSVEDGARSETRSWSW